MSKSDAVDEEREWLPSGRPWVPTVAGVLDMCAGASGLIGGCVLAFLAVAARSVPHAVSKPVPEWPFHMGFALFFSLATLLVVLGLLAVIGGIYTLKCTRGFWPIVGAIAAVILCFPLGIAAIVLTVIHEHETPSKGEAKHS